MRIRKHCPICNGSAEIKSEIRVVGNIIRTLLCGHVLIKKELTPKDLSLTSSDGKTPYKFQLEGAAFAIKAEGRVLIADEQGLGKTLQALLVAHSDPDEFTPLIVLCKSGLKIQWMREAFRWCGWLLQVLDGEDEFLVPGVKGYIVSFDLLHRFKDLNAWIARLNPKLVILDEVQHIKNDSAKRTRCIMSVSQKVDHVIGLSGTPIENNAGEYFPILHILYPEKFYSKEGFIRRWTDSYFTGYSYKVGGIQDVKGFRAFTKDFIIRRTRKEVLPDLPSISRQPRFSELGAEVEKAYRVTFKEFQEYYNDSSIGESSFNREGNVLAYLSKMRHLTGIAKVEPCVDFVTDFLLETDRKICVFVHHIDVGQEICSRLEQRRQDWPSEYGKEILRLSASLDSKQRDDVVSKFWSDGYRVLVASTRASGEGLNLQCCSDCIMLERQWNPSKEEQAECRFIRIGQESDKVTATYLIAVGTVDEFFSELVEQKRQIVTAAMSGQSVAWNESDLIKELAKSLAANGGKKWGW